MNENYDHLPSPEDHSREVWEWFRDMMEILDTQKEGTNGRHVEGGQE